MLQHMLEAQVRRELHVTAHVTAHVRRELHVTAHVRSTSYKGTACYSTC